MGNRKASKLIFVELNEVNFDVVQKYLESQPGKYSAIERLFKGKWIRTTSEKRYNELEPWIQWVSVHTGLSYAEHGVYRLGDMVGSTHPQFYEAIERSGVRVGAISPMNTENRLKNPAYFIPDPWTKTSTDGSWWSNALGSAVAQAVNDNAQSKVTIKSAVSLMLGLMRFAKLTHYAMYLKLALGGYGASWRKALFLDLFLHDVHMGLLATKQPGFSTVFLNAGAHIQHHYFFNADPVKRTSALRNPSWYLASDEDPLRDMLGVYDKIIGEYLSLAGTDVVIATGLAQKPYDRIKYYWRLKDHESFLVLLGFRFESVLPRMTRDFLIEFNSVEAAKSAELDLSNMRVVSNGERLFGEIDNRGESLFVTLTYSSDISRDELVEISGNRFPLYQHVAFVAIKNGMHQDEGFAFFTPGVANRAPADRSHVKALHQTMLGYFGV